MSSISDPVITHRTIAGRQRALMRWYKTHGRHHLPWRHTRDPYAILVSEIMLQQTQVDRVIPYWNTWMQRWPTVGSLARAKRADVIRAWAGLGYNRRAVYLHQLAQRITREPLFRRLLHDSPHPPAPPLSAGRGEMKSIFSHSRLEGEREGVEIAAIARSLRRLPGIGPYTANALLAFAWNLPAPCVDTNVRRVLAYAIYQRPAIMRMPIAEVMRFAARVIPKRKGRDWNYALMDYGALVLTARSLPKWSTPGVDHPRRRTEKFEGSTRFWRGRIVAVLRSSRHALTMRDLRSRITAFGVPPGDPRSLVSALIRDGVVTAVRYRYRLPTT